LVGWFWMNGWFLWLFLMFLSKNKDELVTIHCWLLGECLSGRLGELFLLVLPFYIVCCFSLAMTHKPVHYLVTKPWLACCWACTAAGQLCVCLWWDVSSWLLKLVVWWCLSCFWQEFGQWQVSLTLVLTPWLALFHFAGFQFNVIQGQNLPRHLV
jgi:hypothetical protein